MNKTFFRDGEREALEKIRDGIPAVVAAMNAAADAIDKLYADPGVAKYSPLYSLDGNSESAMFRLMARHMELRGRLADDNIKVRDELTLEANQ